MALQQLMIDNTPNQIISAAVEVDGEQINLQIFIRYNSMAGYWVADISNSDTSELLIASMPLLANANLLSQYNYLQIGSCAIINIGSGSPDSIDENNLGTDFIWCWDDNIS
jgi:hypothetical protein